MCVTLSAFYAIKFIVFSFFCSVFFFRRRQLKLLSNMSFGFELGGFYCEEKIKCQAFGSRMKTAPISTSAVLRKQQSMPTRVTHTHPHKIPCEKLFFIVFQVIAIIIIIIMILGAVYHDIKAKTTMRKTSYRNIVKVNIDLAFNSIQIYVNSFNLHNRNDFFFLRARFFFIFFSPFV